MLYTVVVNYNTVNLSSSFLFSLMFFLSRYEQTGTRTTIVAECWRILNRTR